MKCNHCGKETAGDSVFCEYCGKQMSKNKFNPQLKRQSIIVCVTVALGMAICLLMAFATKGGDTFEIQQADNALETTKHIIVYHNAKDYQWFLTQKFILGSKADEGYNKASLLKKETEFVVNTIEKIKKGLIIEVDKTYEDDNGSPKTAATVKSPNEKATTSQFMKENSNASTLQSTIDQYKANILKLAKQEDRKRLEKAIGLETQYDYSDISLSAAILSLNATEIEILNAESIMLNYLKAGISAEDFRFDQIAVLSVPKSQKVFSGDNYEADIIVAAFDSESRPEVFYKMGVDTLTEAGLASATKLEGENGIVKLKIGTSKTGEQKYAGLIKLVGPGGEVRYFGFKNRFTVLPR